MNTFIDEVLHLASGLLKQFLVTHENAEIQSSKTKVVFFLTV